MALGLRVLQCHDFRMSLSGRLCVTLAEYLAIGRCDDAADTWIRAGQEHGLRRQGQRSVHVLCV